MVTGKDLQHWRSVVERDTSGNGRIISDTVMEYNDRLMEKDITESGNRITKKVKDIKGGQMAMKIGESTRMTRNGERQYTNLMENCTESITKKTISSPGVKYSEVFSHLVEITNMFKY